MKCDGCYFEKTPKEKLAGPGPRHRQMCSKGRISQNISYTTVARSQGASVGRSEKAKKILVVSYTGEKELRKTAEKSNPEMKDTHGINTLGRCS